MLGNFKSFSSFSSNDVDVSKKFYTEQLGLKVIFEIDGAVRFQTGDGLNFMIYYKPNHEPATYTVLNFEVDDLDTVIDELNKKGIMMEQYPEMGTNEKGISKSGPASMAWFKDPSGNIIGLMALKD